MGKEKTVPRQKPAVYLQQRNAMDSDYTVAKLLNTAEFYIGQVLDKQDVRNLINRGTKVEITKKK